VAANQSAGHTAEFMNIGRNVVVALKIGLVETGPTVLVVMALNFQNSSEDLVGCKTQNVEWNGMWNGHKCCNYPVWAVGQVTRCPVGLV